MRWIFGRESGATQTRSGIGDINGAHLLFIGGEDHNLRMPFLTALASRRYDVTVQRQRL
jgi:hypothetical protein